MNCQQQHRPFFILAFLLLINISSYGQSCFQNPPISITFNTSNLECNRDSSGYIAATVTGGSGNPMTLVWSNGMMGVDSIYNLPLGTYTLVVIDSFPSASTTNLYAQAFDGAHGWTLNIPTGVNGAENNFWTVSNSESGAAVGSCGFAGGTNRSLHVTSVFNPVGGATYDAGGLCGSFPPPFGSCPQTNMRAESPVFSTLGHYNVTLDFNYIANGNGLLDNASVVFSADGGITWQVLDSSIKSPICVGGQGLWTKFTAVLPPSCENNPAVKVGINWTNNDDGMGTDPSVAIDSVRVFAISIDSILVCIDSQTVAISNPYILTPQVSCGIAQTNSITVDWADLGLPNSGFYEYSLDSGLTWANAGAALTATITGLNPGTNYTIWVQAGDSSNLSCYSLRGTIVCATENLTCSTIPPINISLSPNNALCNGDSTGCITAIVTGGSGNPLNFAWSNGAMDVDSICNLAFGNYTLVVTDTVAINLAPTNYLELYAQTFDGVHGWTLNVPTGINGTENNFWTASSNEAGMPVGSCGAAGGTNRSLHLTGAFFPSGGAAYDAGGLCGAPFFFACPETNMRAESPVFSTLGQTNIEFSFNYISKGDSLLDNASVVFSADAGITWQVLESSIKSPICGGGQGLWTKFSAILPPSCENNPNVKIGFNWTNNDDGIGSDPSVAIDSVLVSVGGIASTILVCVDSQSIAITNAYALAPTISCDSVSTTEISFSWNNLNLPAGGFYEYSLNNGTTWVNVGTAVAATATGLAANTNYNIWVRANHLSTASCAPSPIGTNSCTTLSVCYNNPPLSINLIPSHLLNYGDSSGCVHATITGGSGNPLNLVWSNGVMDVDSICNLPAGNYTLVVTDTFPNLINTNIYTQAFDGTHGWTLNIPTGVNGADPNFWTVSSNESGMPVGACGTAGGPNRSLHITSAFFPSGGSHYNAGGLCPTLYCPETNMRAESPVFSTIGQSNLSFSFNYIANGDSLLDNASVVFSADGGTTWQVLDASIKSPTCGSGQGLWTKFSAFLPPSCDNNPNVKVGFNWTNNDDGIGTDPSVAIDSVRVFATGPGFITLYCIDSQSITLTQPALLMLVADSIHLPSNIGATDGSIYTSVSGGTPTYQFNWSNGSTTQNLTNLSEGIYILTVTDANGGTDTIQINLMLPNSVVKVDGNPFQITLFPNPTKEYLNLQSNLPFPANTSFEIFNALGQLELSGFVETGTDLWKIDIFGLLDGVHIIRVNTGMGVLGKVFLVGE